MTKSDKNKKSDHPVFDYRTINTVDKAFKKQNLERPKLKDIPAMIPQRLRKAWLRAYELMIVLEAINNGWEPDWSNWNQFKYYPWYEIKSSGSSFVFPGSSYGSTFTSTNVGSRLCTDTSEKALFIAKTFRKEFADLFLIKK